MKTAEDGHERLPSTNSCPVDLRDAPKAIAGNNARLLGEVTVL